MRTFPIYVVDAFADRPFGGNPAGVVLLDVAMTDSERQSIATEMCHSETAFVSRRSDDGFDLRWFTPSVEVPLCGHGTLATAHVLFSTDQVDGAVATFHTLSGVLTVTRRGDELALDLPLNVPEPALPPPGLLDALGLHARQVRDVERGKEFVIECADRATIVSVAPNFRALQQVEWPSGCGGVIVTCAGESPYDFTSRYFGPWIGIDEDPATGAAHAVLAAYWGKRLGKASMLAFQASKRGGIMRVEPDFTSGRVLLIGKAFIVLSGQFQLGA